MLVIPLSPVPAQSLTSAIGGVNYRFYIRQLEMGIFCDMWENDILFIAGLKCLNAVFFRGFQFIDTMGNDDPDYQNLGSRFLLIYGDYDA